jgi:hypothetical protein
MTMTDVIRVRVWIEGVLLPDAAFGGIDTNSAARGGAGATLSILNIPGMRPEEWGRARCAVAWSNVEIRKTRGEDWPMLYDGEIVAYGDHKNPMSRSVQFSLNSEDIHFDQCRLYYFNRDTGANVINVPKTAYFFGNSSIEESIAAPGLDTVNRLVEAIRAQGNAPLPSSMRTAFKATLSTNFFFERARQQLGLDRRFGVAKDDFAALLYSKRDLLFSQLENGVAVREGDTPIRQIIEEMLSKFRYGLTVNPQPTVIRGGDKTDLSPITEQRNQALASAEEICIRLLGVSPSMVPITERTTDEEIKVIALKIAHPTTRANLFPAADLSLEGVSLLSDPATSTGDIQSYMDEIGPSIIESLKLIRSELLRAASTATTRAAVEVMDEDADFRDYVAQFMLLPDMQLAAIPRCNVIFPNENSSYSTSRNFLQEPTRTMKSVPTVNGASDEVYFAPGNLSTTAVKKTPVTTYTGNFSMCPPVLVAGGISKVMGSKFGNRQDPLNSTETKLKAHRGIDLRVPKRTPVLSVLDGTVMSSQLDKPKAGGLYVVIQHVGNDYTKYMHLLSSSVKPGDTVKAGQQIGFSGGDPADGLSAGGSTGPHLHFELHRGSRSNPVNPADFLFKCQDAFDKSVGSGSVLATSSAATEIAAVDEENAQTMADGINNTSEKPFADFEFLTPAEEVLGIVPNIDTSMDRTMTTYSVQGGEDGRKKYLQQLVEADHQSARYSSRSFSPVTMPFTPRLVAGMPGLIVDNFRPVIVFIESVHHSYNPAGEATTTASVRGYRFWDEGDPYYWRGGREAFKEATKDQDGVKQPDPDVANFPGFMLPSIFATNSYEGPPETSNEPFGGKNQARPNDAFFESMIGCKGLPYYYTERQSPITGETLSYNAFIGHLVNYYRALVDTSHEAASGFVDSFTSRSSMHVDEYFLQLLKCQPGAGGYNGPAFRATIRAVVLDYVAKVSSSHAFRG